MKKFKDARNRVKTVVEEQRQSSSKNLSDTTTEIGIDLKQKANCLASNSNYIREIYRKYEAQNKHAAHEIESGRVLGDSFREFATKASGLNSSQLTECLQKVGGMQRGIEDLRSDLHSKITKLLCEPLRNCVKGEIKEALDAEKKYDRARNNYDASITKLKGLSEKTKVNLSKIGEAEQERDLARKQFQSTEQESFELISQTTEKIEFEMLSRLVRYIESYYEFFEESLQQISLLLPEIQEYRKFVENARTQFEEKTNRTTERIVDPRWKPKFHPQIQVKSRESSSSDLSPDMTFSSNKSAEDLEEDEADDNREDIEGIKRKKILQEMLHEEKTYVSQLATIKTTYLEPMRRLTKDAKVKIGEEEVSTIFFNLEELYVMHTKLLDELENAVENYPSISIGQIFLNKLENLKAYISYTSNFSNASQTLKDVKQYRAVNNILKNGERIDSTGLSVLLQIPLKRINQYEFWLEKLFEFTKTTDNDFENLSNAIDAISQLSNNVLKSNVRAGELAEVMSVQKKLTGFEENLVEPGRYLVKQGVLGMIQTNKKSKKENIKIANYHWFLFNDIFLYTSKSKIATGLANPRQAVNINLLKEVLKYKGHLITNKMRVKEIANSTFLRNAFKLIMEDEEFTVCAPTVEEKNNWIRTIKDTIEKAQSMKVFGVPLAQVMKNPQEVGRSIPRLATLTMNFISENGMEVEGIFRLSGSANEIQNMKEQLDRGKEINPRGKDPHAIAGLFKLWLREMPEPILSYSLYDKWISIAQLNVKEAVSYSKKLLEQLPIYNRFLLQYLMKFLVEVSKREEFNKMGASNLSLVFGPNILYKKDADPFDTSELKFVYALVQIFIENYSDIFSFVEEERRQFEEQELKGLEDKKVKEIAEREKVKQEAMEEKREKEERIRKEKQEREKKKLQEKLKEKQEKEDLQKKKQEQRERREREEREKKIQKEREEEEERERLRKQMEEKRRIEMEKEREKQVEEKKRRQKELELKRERGSQEYQKLREKEEAKYRQALEEKKKKKQERLSRSGTSSSSSSSSSLSLSICAGCNEPIEKQGLQALDKKWHAECFVCSHCKKQLSGNFMHNEGKPYCHEDFAKLFSKHCAGCNKLITGPMIRALGKPWHPSGCFVCSQCRGTLAQGFFEKDGKPYCESCI